MDRYSQELARYLPVTVVRTKRYRLGLRGYLLMRSLQRFRQLVHLPNQHLGRFAIAAGIPYVVTVHDLERISLSRAKENLVERLALRLDALAIKQAKHVIAVSQNTKVDLMKHLDIPEGKITVVLNGVDHTVFKPSHTPPVAFPYLLYVGSERPRKNLGRLLTSFALLKKSGQFSDLKLVKVGTPGRSPIFRQMTHQYARELGLEGEVVFVDRVSDQQLAEYYSHAQAMVYPSLYEGFGLPVLEAMACGCPVITSNVSSLPEVAGDAALLVNPFDVGALYQAMFKVLTDFPLRERMTANGLRRSGQFCWERAAAGTLEVYRQVEMAESVRSEVSGVPKLDLSTECEELTYVKP